MKNHISVRGYKFDTVEGSDAAFHHGCLEVFVLHKDFINSIEWAKWERRDCTESPYWPNTEEENDDMLAATRILLKNGEAIIAMESYDDFMARFCFGNFFAPKYDLNHLIKKTNPCAFDFDNIW